MKGNGTTKEVKSCRSWDTTWAGCPRRRMKIVWTTTHSPTCDRQTWRRPAMEMAAQTNGQSMRTESLFEYSSNVRTGVFLLFFTNYLGTHIEYIDGTASINCGDRRSRTGHHHMHREHASVLETRGNRQWKVGTLWVDVTQPRSEKTGATHRRDPDAKS